MRWELLETHLGRALGYGGRELLDRPLRAACWWLHCSEVTM